MELFTPDSATGHAQHPRYSLDKNYAHLIWRSKPIDNTENALTEKSRSENVLRAVFDRT